MAEDTRNYSYGASEPVDADQRDLIFKQILKSHRFYNKGIEIERARQEAYRDIRNAVSADLAALDKKYKEFEDAYEEARMRLAKVRDPEKPEQCLPKSKRSSSAEALAIMSEMRGIKLAKQKHYAKIKDARIAADAVLSANTGGYAVLLQGLKLDHIIQHDADSKDDAAKAERRAAAVALALEMKAKPVGANGRPEAMSEEDHDKAWKKLNEFCGPRVVERINHEAFRVYSSTVEEGESERATAARKQIAMKREFSALQNSARRDSECHPGQYGFVERALRAAISDTRGPPAFKSWDGTGAVGVDRDISVRDLMSGANAGLSVRIVDGPVRKSGAVGALVDSMPNATPSEVAALAAERGLHVTEGMVLDIRSRPRRDERKAAKQRPRSAILSMVLGNAGKGGTKQLVEIPFVLHRPLPEDGEIKQVYLHVSRIGSRKVYELIFTISASSFGAMAVRRDFVGGVPMPPERRGTLAVNLGWRMVTTADGLRGIRVAKTWDGFKSEEVILENRSREKHEYAAQTLIGHSDKHFMEAKAVFAAYLKKYRGEVDFSSVHELTSKKWDTIHLWQSHANLIRSAEALVKVHLGDAGRERIRELWQKWRAERFSHRPSAAELRLTAEQRSTYDLFLGFEATCAWLAAQGVASPHEQMALFLEWWRRKDVHLTDMARNIQKRIQRNRREVYRVKAAQWAAQYERVVIEKWDKSATAKTPAAENDVRTKQQEKAAAIRQFCGVSIFTLALKERLGKRLVEASAEGITRTHFDCGGVAGDAVTDVDAACPKCSRQFDQDLNAARHLWERESLGGGESPGGARKSPKAKKSRKNQQRGTEAVAGDAAAE